MNDKAKNHQHYLPVEEIFPIVRAILHKREWYMRDIFDGHVGSQRFVRINSVIIADPDVDGWKDIAANLYVEWPCEYDRSQGQREVEIRFNERVISACVREGLFEMLKNYLLHDLATQLLEMGLINQDLARKIEG